MILARSIDDFKGLVFLQYHDPSGCNSSRFLGTHESSDCLMVGINLEWLSKQVFSKVFDSPNNSKLFQLSSCIISFGAGSCSTGISNDNFSIKLIFLG